MEKKETIIVKKDDIEKEIEQWKGYYHNYNTLSVQVLADVLAFYKADERQALVDKANEFLESVKEPISGELMVNSIKGDLESFEKIAEESKIALRTLEWVKSLEEEKK